MFWRKADIKSVNYADVQQCFPDVVDLLQAYSSVLPLQYSVRERWQCSSSIRDKLLSLHEANQDLEPVNLLPTYLISSLMVPI